LQFFNRLVIKKQLGTACVKPVTVKNVSDITVDVNTKSVQMKAQILAKLTGHNVVSGASKHSK